MSQGDAWTIGRLLSWTADYLKERGAENARLDAEILLAHCLGAERIDLYVRIAEEPPESVREKFRGLIKRRAGGEPVAYLVERKEFYSLAFRVTPDVLIPRPETELLVVAVTDFVREKQGEGAPVAVCDIGTGSGAIAVSLAKYLPTATVTAVDISPAALAVARSNAATHGVADRVTFVESDVYSGIPADAAFDYIVSNPPYVTESEMESLPSDVRDFEPHLALCGGPEGVDVIERLLAGAPERLTPGGRLLIEIGPSIHATVVARIEAAPGLEVVETRKDLARHPRVVVARRV